MAIFRIEKTDNYTAMSNYHLRDKNLSLKAKGLLSFMLSLPDDWDYSIRGLSAVCKEEKSTIERILKELKDNDYLKIKKLLPNETKTGRFEYEYIIYETPQKTRPQKQGIEKQDLENGTQINTNIQNTKKINNSTTTNNSNFEDVFDIIQNNFGRTLNDLEYETIKSWKNYNFPVELLIYAIKKTVLKNIYNISYIDKILYEWDKNNIKTVAQAQKSDEEHSNKKKQFKQVYPKRETEQERYERQLREAEEYDRREALRNEQG